MKGRWVVPIEQFEEPNPRLEGFRRLAVVNARVPSPIHVITHEGFDVFLENRDKWRDGIRQHIQQPFEVATRKSKWGNLALRAAYAVGGVTNLRGPRFLGIRTLEDLVYGVGEVYKYAFERGYHGGGGIVCFFYPFIDPPPVDSAYQSDPPSLPYGGYAMPIDDEGRIIQVLAAWGNNETLGDYEAEGRQVESYEVEIAKRWPKTRIREKVIPYKPFMNCTTVRSSVTGSERVSVPMAYQLTQVLGEPEILEVARVVSKLTARYGQQRVEFVSDGDKVFFNEAVDWKVEQESFRGPVGTVSSSVFVYRGTEDIDRLRRKISKRPHGLHILYIAPNMLEGREKANLELYTLASQFPKSDLMILLPKWGRTSHAGIILREAGHLLIPIGPQLYKWQMGDSVRITDNGRATQVENTSVNDLRKAIPLVRAQALGDELVGLKAARLAQLLVAGYNVPNGIVLTTNFFDSLLAANKLNQTYESFSSLGSIQQSKFLHRFRHELREIPGKLWHEVEETLERVELLSSGNLLKPLAVRSSANVEDMEIMSFAGVFHSVLNITGTLDTLKEAVLTCIKSAFSERVLDYLASRHRLDLLQRLKMAVLIQPMVKPQLAGTLFTTDPDSGDSGKLVIEAASGQSELVVSGTRVDEQIDVCKVTGIVRSRKGKSLLRKEEIRLLSLLGKALEHMFGQAQDIEWAIDEELELWVLQSRALGVRKV